VVEGNTGRRDAVFTVAFSRPLGQDATVCLVPIGITALPVVDFDLRLPCGTLAAGETSTDLGIPSGATVNGSGTRPSGWWHSRPAGSATATLWQPRPSSTTTNGPS
jgi:hypothetical protein